MTDATDDTADPADQNLRTQLVRVSWMADHGGTHARLERADVWEIAWRLISANIHPTGEVIRIVNGGKGSPNVIHPALKSFFDGELQRRISAPPPVAGIPQSVLEMWHQAVLAARNVAQKEIEIGKQDIEQQRKHVEETAHRIQEEQQRMLDREQANKALLDKLTADLDREINANALEKQRHESALKHLGSAHEKAIHDLANQVELTRDEEREKLALVAKLESTGDALRSSEASHAKCVLDHDRTLKHQDALTEQLRAAMEQIAKTERTCEKLRETIDTQREEHAATIAAQRIEFEQRMERSNHEQAALQSEVAATTAERDVLRAQITSGALLLESAQQEATRWAAEAKDANARAKQADHARDDLTRQLADIAKKKQRKDANE